MRTIACLLYPRENELVADACPIGHSLLICDNPLEVVGASGAGNLPASVLWGVEPGYGGDLVTNVAALRRLNASMPHLLRLAITPDTAGTVLAIVKSIPIRVVISLRAHHEIASDFRLLGQMSVGGRADASILTLIGQAWPGDSCNEAAAAVVGAVLVGRQPTPVAKLAAVLGSRPQQLGSQLRQCTVMDARTLLRWAFVLHSVADIQQGRRPLKVIANQAGYRTSEALTNRLARLCGMRVRDVISRGGLPFLVEVFVERVFKAS